MSLYVFLPRFTKGHLITTFQSNNLELAAIHESTSINPFHYAPQLDQILVTKVKKEVKEEQNKKSFAIAERNCKKMLALIKGIGKINSMDNVPKTCANIDGIQLAIVDITAGKPLLYQYAWKVICFLENYSISLAGMRATRSPLRTYPCFLLENFISFFSI
jgi:hypothetical protein